MSKWEGAPKLIFVLGPQISLNGPACDNSPEP